MNQPAMTIDLFPTIAKLVGAELPKHKIDGLDIWPLLAGDPKAKNPHEAYYFYYNSNELQAVRSGSWKLILPHKYSSIIDQPRAKDGVRGSYKASAAKLELYNLEKDAGETTDVAGKFPEVVKRLEALAEKAREDMGDSLTNRVGKGTREPGRIREN